MPAESKSSRGEVVYEVTGEAAMLGHHGDETVKMIPHTAKVTTEDGEFDTVYVFGAALRQTDGKPGKKQAAMSFGRTGAYLAEAPEWIQRLILEHGRREDDTEVPTAQAKAALVAAYDDQAPEPSLVGESLLRYFRSTFAASVEEVLRLLDAAGLKLVRKGP